MKKEKRKFKYLVISIYLLAFIFFGYKMFFYAENVGRFPDEIYHISYIATLEKEHVIIPNFKTMEVLTLKNPVNANSTNQNINKNIPVAYTFIDSINYLGHPPLYYQIMRLSRAVQIKGDIVYVNVFKLRCFNIALSALALLLIFYIGYTRISENPILHLLFATIVVSVPMLAYSCAGVNNDTLAFVGLAIFLFGLLRFSERKRNFWTYFIISIGVFIAFLSKLTTGLIVLISIFIYIVLISVKEKNARFLISKEFLVTLPMYIAIIFYFIVVRLQTGSIQPSFKLLDPVNFYKSGFYVAIANRTHMTFVQYITYFAKNFLESWSGIISHVSLLKTGSIFSINSIALIALLFIPIIMLFQIKRAVRNSSTMLVLISVYFGIVISVTAQCLRAYNEYVNVSGYLGGFGSRYYLCGIPVIALSVTFIVKNYFEKLSITNPAFKTQLKLRYNKTKNRLNRKKVVLFLICLFFICLLYYEDFIYFLINFKDYI